MARSFNGTSDLIAVDNAHIVAQGTAFSVAFWVKASASASDVYAYDEGRSTNNNTLFGIHQNAGAGGKFTVILRNDGGTIRLNANSANVQMDGTWHHFIYAQDASNNVALYTDGANKETSSYTTFGLFTNDRATIGALVRTGTGNFFPGTLAHVALFNRQLTDGEAASLGAGLLPSHLAPLHYWPLWGVDSPEPDIGTGTHVAGTLTGTSQGAGGPPVGRGLIVLRGPSGFHAPAAGQSVEFGKSAETETARAFTWKRSLAFGKATETDTANAASAAKRLGFGKALETDTAHAFTAAKRLAFGKAAETDTAYTFSQSQGFNVGQASELDVAYQITWTKRLAFGQATETSAAYHFTVHIGVDAVPVYTKRTRATAGNAATAAATGKGRTRTSTNSGVTDA